MKKFFVTLAVLALAVSAFAFSAAAATKAADVIAAAKAAVPDEYEYLYLAQLETVLNATNPDETACADLIELIEKNAALTDKGGSLSDYTPDEREALLVDFDKAAEILGVSYAIEAVANGSDDVKAVIYYNNQPIAELDGDAIKQTDVEDSASMVWPVAVAAVLLTAVAAFVFGKKALN